VQEVFERTLESAPHDKQHCPTDYGCTRGTRRFNLNFAGKEQPLRRYVPIDFHCHGIGRFDFAEPNELVLDELESHLSIEGTAAILTLYLPRHHLGNFESFMVAYAEGVRARRYHHILGIGLEGPLLASFGGTPELGCWQPSRTQWERIAALGRLGLQYVVISPNAEVQHGSDSVDSVKEIIEILLAEGVRPALGHYGYENPEFAARMTEDVCEMALRAGKGPFFTDHLYNDMPVNAQYKWRTGAEKRARRCTTPVLLQYEWTDDNIDDVLGIVPATLIRYAKRGAVKLSINCDGDHVDIEICKRTIEFVGADNIMLMTDRIQSEILAGQRLEKNDSNSLLYQRAGIVAGGTQSIMRQLGNLMTVGVPSSDILKLSHGTANLALRDKMVTDGNGRTLA
jgi:N-acetylglucosamine-6-phosphate deacetylase